MATLTRSLQKTLIHSPHPKYGKKCKYMLMQNLQTTMPQGTQIVRIQ